MHRLLAACGVIAPLSFISGWLVAGARTEGYSPGEQAISDLAAEGAATRPLMTSALVSFGVLMPLYAPALGEALDSRAVRWSATVAGITTLGVAAFPLTQETGTAQDVAHAAWAGTGYLAMAVSPVIGGLALRRLGHPRAAAVSYAIGAVSAVGLVGSVTSEHHGGLFQRTGLTVVDLWFAGVAAVVVSGRTLRGSSGGRRRATPARS